MAEVSIRELKDGLSTWLRRAEAGEHVVVTRGGKPVAALVPLSDLPSRDPRAILADLASRGTVTLPRRAEGAFTGSRVAGRGVSAGDMVVQDRR